MELRFIEKEGGTKRMLCWEAEMGRRKRKEENGKAKEKETGGQNCEGRGKNKRVEDKTREESCERNKEGGKERGGGEKLSKNSELKMTMWVTEYGNAGCRIWKCRLPNMEMQVTIYGNAGYHIWKP